MIPDWLSTKLADVPAAGTGLHAWLFSCARQLHAHMDPAAVETVLAMATARSDRRVPRREIHDAVINSEAVAWQQKDFSGGDRRSVQPSNPNTSRAMGGYVDSSASSAAENLRWPQLTPRLRNSMIAAAARSGIESLYDLWESSPTRVPRLVADDWIDILFPDAEWLCLAVDHPATARSRRREQWSFGPADECGLIVPSPMTGPGGIGLDGRRTHRCLDNTGPRRWLVIEFDSGSIDEQAALHWQLRASCAVVGWPRLALAVHSAGKSLHGWYGPVENEELARELMGYAASLGADTAGWNRCQLMRLPGGVRKVAPADAHLPDGWEEDPPFARLEVFFFDPSTSASCFKISNSSSSVLGAPADSTPLLTSAAA
jgi:hypothetical protein